MQTSSIAAPDRPGKRPEELQVHQPPTWARYESEEEEVSEADAASHHLLSPVESDSEKESTGDDDDDSRPSRNDQLLSLGHGVSPTMSPRSRPISIATVKRSSTATFVPEHDHACSHDRDDHDNDGDHDCDDDTTGPFTPSTTPPMPSPLLPQTCVVVEDSPDGDMMPYYRSLFRNSIISDDGLDVEDEIFEAKQIMYMAPPSRPCLISIHHSPTESTVAARMGRPVSPRRCSVKSARSSGSRRTSRASRCERESGRKMSTSSGLSCSPERTKRCSTIVFRDPFRSEGEEVYLRPPQMDSRTRAASPTDRRSSRAFSARRSRSLSREDVGRYFSQEAARRGSETQADQARPKTSGSGACLSDMPLRRPVPTAARPATFYQQGRWFRSSSFNSDGTASSAFSASSSKLSALLTQNTSTTSLPLSAQSPDPDRKQLIRHPRLSSLTGNSPEAGLRGNGLPTITTAAAAAAPSHYRSESSYSDFGPSRSGNARGSLTYPYVKGDRRSQLSTLRANSSLSLEVDQNESSSGREVVRNEHASYKPKPKPKGLMGFRLRRKRES
ncbi:hypothetical protein VTN96DRAFT_3225 [Rasamsonia emersonii]